MQASRLQLKELRRKLIPAASIKASDARGHTHAQQAFLDGQEAIAPSQPALRAASKGPYGAGNASATAASSRDIPPELPHARAAPSIPDPTKHTNAKAATDASHNLQQTEDRALSKRPEPADQLGSEPPPASVSAVTQAADQQASLVAAPSAAHISTAPQVAAESHEQPGNSVLDVAAGKDSSNKAQQDVAAAKQSSNNTQQAQDDCSRGEKATILSGVAEPSDHAVSYQADTQEASRLTQPLLGLSSVTPLPPPVLSPTRAVPNALAAAPHSPNGPLSEKCQNRLMGWTAVTALPPSIPLPTAAQGQPSPAHQTSSSPASSPAALALIASDVDQQPALASLLPAQASPLPAHTSALPTQASPLPAQASPLPVAAGSLHTAAGHTALWPQQLPAAAALQSPSISVAAVPSGSAKEAGVHKDDDTEVTDVSAPGPESSGAVNARASTSQPVADGGFFVCLHESWRKPVAAKGCTAALLICALAKHQRFL